MVNFYYKYAFIGFILFFTFDVVSTYIYNIFLNQWKKIIVIFFGFRYYRRMIIFIIVGIIIKCGQICLNWVVTADNGITGIGQILNI